MLRNRCPLWIGMGVRKLLESVSGFIGIHNSAQPYCVPVVACRGFDSVSYLHNFKLMAEKALQQGKTPTVLYFGDLDPSGVEMLRSSIITLEDEIGLHGATFKRIALNPEQVLEYGLLNDPDGGKKTDRNYKKYVKKYGLVFVELDALSPKQLETLIRNAIESELDMESFDDQKSFETSDNSMIYRIRQRVTDVFNDELGTNFSI